MLRETSLPHFVVKEVQDYLRCGRREYGFVRVQCSGCRHEHLTCPTLLIRGAESDFLSRATAEEMVRRNGLIRLVDVPGATHYVHDDNFQAFFAALDAFLG